MSDSDLDEEAVFSAARRIEAPDARAAYLRQACGNDHPLFDRVTALLRMHTKDGGFLESPVEILAGTASELAVPETPGTVIGPYKLLEQIGVGGMGLVFMAEQQRPVRRKVALKIIKPGMDTHEVIARFEAERQTLAMMDHPHIARVLDAGATDSGRPYFVMELVRGIPVTEYCDQARLEPWERLNLFIAVCEAVQHAHQKGIIHRDLKPSNILVTMHDDKAVPKVIDFGVAKAMNQRLVEGTLFTKFAQMIGTPTYMSPEQAQMSGLDVDTRSDVYSLGVLLYELLTGSTPFDKQRLREAGYDEMRRIIREEEPPRPSARATALDANSQSTIAHNRAVDPRKFSQALRGDLDWIVMKALEKDRTRRYETVSALIADIKRHLADEPVEAFPPSAAYRLRKFARRRKSLFALLSLVAGFLLVSIVGLAIGYVLISREQTEVLRQRNLAQTREETVRARETTIHGYLYAADIQLAFLAYDRGDVPQAREKLLRHQPDPQTADIRGFEWHYLWNLCDDDNEVRTYRGHQRDVFGVLFSRDGKQLVSTSADRTAVVWNVAEGKPQTTLRDFGDDVNGPAFSEDGTLLALAEENKTVSVWDVKTGRETARLAGFDLPVVQVFFTRDSTRLVATEVEHKTGAANFSLWDLATQTRLKFVEGRRALDVDTQAGLLAAADVTGRLSLWSLPELEQQATWLGDGAPVLCGAFSPDGKSLATGCRSGTATLWKLADFTGRPLPLSISTVIRGFAFTPDGRRLVSVGDDTVVRVWDVPSATLQRILGSTHGRLWSAGISPDGTTLAVACGDGSIEFRDFSKMTMQKLRIHESPAGFGGVAADSSGDRIAVLDASQTVISILDANNGNLLDRFSAPDGDMISAIAFSADDQSLWTGTGRGLIRQLNPTTGAWRDEVKSHSEPIMVLFVSPTGRFLAITSAPAKIWDREAARIALTLDDDSAHVLMGFLSESIAVSVRVGVFRLWDLQTGRQLPRRFPDVVAWIEGMAVTPDGQTLATGTSDGAVHVWDVASGQKTATLLGHRQTPTVLTFSPDGRTLATGSHGGEIKLWHLPTAQPLGDLPGHTGKVRLLAFSRDGRRLISAADTPERGSEVLVWGLSAPNSSK